MDHLCEDTKLGAGTQKVTVTLLESEFWVLSSGQRAWSALDWQEGGAQRAALEFALMTHLEVATFVLVPSQETQGPGLLPSYPLFPSGLVHLDHQHQVSGYMLFSDPSSESSCPNFYGLRALLIWSLVSTSSCVLYWPCSCTVNAKKKKIFF